ncbi:MAG: hypothetical protein KJ060_12725, partial [Candidatus Hydrogenedentes bacterium]|nr:hypothetical protein [Candidatus Hydrogenedentota bacterium]
EEELQPAANTRVRVAAKSRSKPATPQGAEVAFEADPVESRAEESDAPDRVALDRDADAVEEPEDESTPVEQEVEPEPAPAVTPAASEENSDEPADDKEKQGQAIWDFF